MFFVTEAEATIIRTAFEQRGEFAAAVELRRLFRGISNSGVARECVRAIAGRTLVCSGSALKCFLPDVRRNKAGVI